MSICFVLSIMLSVCSASAGTVTLWELVYEHDANGVKTSGSFETLNKLF